MQTGFLQRHAKVFGRANAAVLRIAGLTASECRGEGATVIDAGGERWFDFGSFGVHLLGHCHPALVAVAQNQVARLGLSTKILGNEQALGCAEKIAALTSGHHDGVLLANSGSEAVEMSLRVSRIVTKRRHFIALEGAYHGRTDGALQLSRNYQRHAGAPDAGNVSFVRPGDLETLAAILNARDCAAMFVEPVQGEGGIRQVDPTFLRAARELCAAHGTLFVSDEIQCGLGRCGRLVSCPSADIVVYGKTLAGGMVPISAIAFSSERIGAAARDPIASGSSFAGGALAGAVASAVIDEVTAPGFVETVREKGAKALTSLGVGLASRNTVVDMRGYGLMIGIEFSSPGIVGEVILEAAKRRLLVTFCLSAPSVLRLYPPAVATDAEIEDAAGRLVEAVAAAERTVATQQALPVFSRKDR